MSERPSLDSALQGDSGFSLEQNPLDQPAFSQEPAPSTPTIHPLVQKAKGTWRGRSYLLISGIFLLILTVIFYFIQTGQGGILIVAPPDDVSISLNNGPVRVKHQSRGLFIPAYAGQYHIKISKPNYEPFEQDILIGRRQTVVLRPVFSIFAKPIEGTGRPIDYVIPSGDQKFVFYLGNDREAIYRMEVATREPTKLTDAPLREVSDIQWSSDPNVALITQSDGIYLHEIPRFDLRSQTLVRIGGGEMISPIWDPTNPERLAFIYIPGTGEHSLVFSDRRITHLDRKTDVAHIPNPKLIWSSDSSLIALIGRSQNLSENNLWIYNTSENSLRQVTEGGNIVNASFSPDSQLILYETAATTDPQGNLIKMRTDTDEKTPLAISGKAARVAWKDAGSFFLPDPDHNALVLYRADGKVQTIPFAFPDSLSIKGMYYFSESSTLIFYTENAVYTVNLAV